MTLIDALRAVGAVGWLYIFVTSVGAFWRVLRGRSRDHDVLWGRDAMFALMILAFNLRWYVAANSETVHLGLYVFSIIVAVQSIRAGRAYRGKRNG